MHIFALAVIRQGYPAKTPMSQTFAGAFGGLKGYTLPLTAYVLGN